MRTAVTSSLIFANTVSIRPHPTCPSHRTHGRQPARTPCRARHRKFDQPQGKM